MMSRISLQDRFQIPSLVSIPILQRYILKELLTIFAFLLSGLTVLLVFVGVFREVSANSLGAMQALQILPYIVPSLLPFTVPATLLLTVCVVYGRMAGDREITAAKAAGINVLSLLLPAFALGGLLSLGSLLLVDKAIPWAEKNIRKTVTLAMEDIFLARLQSDGQIVDNDRGYSITVLGVQNKRLIRPTFHYQPKGSKPITVQAQEATLEFDLDQQQVILHMYRANVNIPGQRQGWFKQHDQSFPIPYSAPKTKPRHLSIRRIKKKLRDVNAALEETRQKRDANTAVALTLGDFDRLLQPDMFEYESQKEFHRKDLAKLRTEIHSRFALSSSCFFFAFLGAPFAVIQARRQFLTSFFMCFLPILVIYYPIALLAMNLSKTESAPAYTVWIANIVLFLIAIFMLRKVLRH
ncbi:MAG: LptF/LptG family permease [Planctomycetaceae bacterium]